MSGKLTVTAEEQHDPRLWDTVEQAARSVDADIVLTPHGNRTERSWNLKNLDCADCAAKIEHAVAGKAHVQKATVDFMHKKMTVTADRAMDEKFWKEIERLVAKTMPGLQTETIAENGPCPFCGQGRCECDSRETGRSPWLNANLAYIAVAAPLFFMGMFLFSGTASIALVIASFLVSGHSVLWRAVRNLFRGKVFDEHFLMAVASLGAIAIGQYAEGAAVMLFYQVGEYFQGAAVDSSRRSIAKAMDLKSDSATVVTDGKTVVMPPEQVRVGSVVRVRNGEKIPLDGVVRSGTSLLDTKSLTGESLPVSVGPGSQVNSGSVNLSSVLEITVTKAYGDSTVSKIMKLVEEASAHKAPSEQFITRFARYYTPMVVVSAALLAFVPTLAGGAFSTWFYRALVFLVISCPCALVVSVPLSFFAGIGRSARLGVLVKGGNYLQALGEIDTIVFDKTGTLTEGRFSLVRVSYADDLPLAPATILAYASVLEANSTHPIARAFDATVDRGLLATEVTEIPGKGIAGRVDGHAVLAGNRPFLEEHGIDGPGDEDGQGSVLIAVDGRYVASADVSDEPKPMARESIARLKRKGIGKTVMLSGDSVPVATRIGNELGIDEIHAGLLPQQKVARFETLKRQGKKIAFVGDGINDAPVLSRSDVGIAMGGLGSDAAIEAADIVILDDKLQKIPQVLAISRKTARIVKENIVLALGFKGLTLLLGALGIATMWWAVFADVGVAIIAILNSLRLLFYDPAR
jgi:Cd2+/Zn2+-exporting ATPase